MHPCLGALGAFDFQGKQQAHLSPPQHKASFKMKAGRTGGEVTTPPESYSNLNGKNIHSFKADNWGKGRDREVRRTDEVDPGGNGKADLQISGCSEFYGTPQTPYMHTSKKRVASACANPSVTPAKRLWTRASKCSKTRGPPFVIQSFSPQIFKVRSLAGVN